MVTQAWPKADVQRLKDAGTKIYHPNYEVWDADLFAAYSPGKNRYIGRDEWIRRVLEAAEIFGPSHVIPNFVGGIEMAKPYGLPMSRRRSLPPEKVWSTSCHMALYRDLLHGAQSPRRP